jgi:hypothetical protein
MSSHEPLSPELSKLEASLASLAPAAGRLDRDRLMYEAGRATARRSATPWLAGSAVAVVALFVGRWTVSPQELSQVAISMPPTQNLTAKAGDRERSTIVAMHDPQSYAQLRLRLETIEQGDVIAARASVLPSESSRGSLFRELLN